jgi:hypothetical protein
VLHLGAARLNRRSAPRGAGEVELVGEATDEACVSRLPARLGLDDRVQVALLAHGAGLLR